MENGAAPASGVPATTGADNAQLAPWTGVPAPENDAGAALRRRVGALWRYRWLILALGVIGTAGGTIATRFIAQKYAAQATLWIQAPMGRSGGGMPFQQQALLNESRAWTELLRSYTVLDWVVVDQRLYLATDDPSQRRYFEGFAIGESFRPGSYRLVLSDDGQRYSLRMREGGVVEEGRVGDAVGAQLGFQWQPGAGQLPAGRTLDFDVMIPRDVAVRLNQQLQTRTNDQAGRFLRVSLEDDDPSRAAATLSAIMHRFVDVAGELSRSKLDETTALLGQQLSYAEQEMRGAETALEGFRVQTITLPSELATPIAPGIEATRAPALTHFFDLKIRSEQLLQDRDGIERALGDGAIRTEALEIIPSVRESSMLVGALQELNAKRAELRALQRRYTDEHSMVQRAQEEVQTLERVTVPSLARALQQELDLRSLELGRQVTSAGGEMRQIPPRMIEEARLRRQVAIAEQLYTTLQQRFSEARLSAASTVAEVSILDEPAEPQYPLRGTTPLSLILMGIAAGLGAGIAVALVLDRVDSKIRYPEQITGGFGLPILAGLPQIRSGRSAESMHQVVEAFRSLRFNVQQAYGSAGPIVFTVTSPGSGDGKSFVSSNLAVAFADLGLRTLLIDGDIRRGKLHHLLGAQRTPGLTDYLMGTTELEPALQGTSYPRLKFLGCGHRLAQGPELLNSVAMRDLVMHARKHFDVVIMDSAPLGAGADPYVMSTLTGNMLLVLRTGATERPFAQSHLDMVDRLPIRILGAVMNAVPDAGSYRYYTYLPGYEARDENMDGSEPLRELEPARA